MPATTYEDLERRISSDTISISEMCGKVIHAHTTYIKMHTILAFVAYKSIKIAWNIRNIEEHCAFCSKENCAIKIKQDLKTTGAILNRIVKKATRAKVSSIFLSPIKHSADYMENKAENLALASDKEFKKMVSQLADRMN
jgi:hypothetical protein